MPLAIPRDTARRRGGLARGDDGLANVVELDELLFACGGSVGQCVRCGTQGSREREREGEGQKLGEKGTL